MIHERRLVRICVPKDNRYTIDWELEFTVGAQAIILSATPVTDETPWGGYSGLGWRAARSLCQFRTLNSEGHRGGDQRCQSALDRPERHSRRCQGCGSRSRHPRSSLQSQAPVDLLRLADTSKFGYINPSLVRDEPLELAPNAKLNLKYRIVVHDGWPDAEGIERDFHAFTALR